jgi:O-antigen ligase
MEIRYSKDWGATVAVFAYLFAYILFPESTGIINVARVFLFLILVLGILSLRTQLRKRDIAYLFWNFMFCALTILSAMWALDKNTAYSGAKTVIWNTLCIGAIYFYCLRNTMFAWKIIEMFPIIPLSWPFIIIVRYGVGTLLDVRSHMYGAMYNRPGITAAWGAIIAYFIFRRRTMEDLEAEKTSHRKWRWIFLLDVFVCILTTSRKALLVIVLGCALYEIISSRNALKILRNIIILCGIVVILWYIVVHVEFLYNLIGRNMEGLLNAFFGSGENLDNSTLGRMNRIVRGISWFRKRMFLGYGTENYSVLSGVYRSGFNGIADNNYIELLVDFGLVGFLLYYGFIARCLIKHIKKMRCKPESFLSVLLLVTLLVSDYGSSNYKSVLAALIIMLCYLFSENNEVNNQVYSTLE